MRDVLWSTEIEGHSHAEIAERTGSTPAAVAQLATRARKLFGERYSLVRFGTGFLRLALETRTPLIPAAFFGGGEAVPTVLNLYKLGKLIGAPYVPVTPYLLAMPLPVKVELHFGEAMRLVGTGNEEDREIEPMVDRVKQRIEELIENGRRTYKPLALLKGKS